MKLRTTHNSIRVRIRKSELLQLQQAQSITESIRFSDDVSFTFALTIDSNSDEVNAVLENNNLIVSIPQKEATRWIGSNQVGIEQQLRVTEEEQLHLLIEKDFPCLDRENEDKSDTFWELAPEAPEAC